MRWAFLCLGEKVVDIKLGQKVAMDQETFADGEFGVAVQLVVEGLLSAIEQTGYRRVGDVLSPKFVFEIFVHPVHLLCFHKWNFWIYYIS